LRRGRRMPVAAAVVRCVWNVSAVSVRGLAAWISYGASVCTCADWRALSRHVQLGPKAAADAEVCLV
jgi:hypothetical protein